MLDWQKTYRLILDEVSRTRLLRTAVRIQEYNATMSFTGLGRGAAWLANSLADRGIEARLGIYPADGTTKIGDRVLPLAWDVDDAELHLVDPSGTVTLLASYKRTPHCVVMFAAGTDGVVEAPIVHFDPAKPRGYLGWQDADFDGVPVRGSCVFFEVQPDARLLAHLVRRGAVGFIADGSGRKSAHHQREPDAIRWVNDAFGEGMISRYRTTLPGFSISPRQGALLRERLQAGEPLRARFRIAARAEPGEFYYVRGVLPGSTAPEERVFVLAHLFEPNVSNNCSGVAVLSEALGALKDLTRRGELPVPRRSVELFSSWEMFGITAYATNNPDVKRNGIAGLGIDCLVRRDNGAERERIVLDSAPDAAPTFLNGAMNVFLDHFAAQSGLGWVEQNGFTSNENMLSDPTLGPPTVLVSGSRQFTDGSYHTDADTADKLDTVRLAHLAALVGTAAYMVAAAGEDEARWFAHKAFGRGRRRLAELAESAVDATRDRVAERLDLLVDIEQESVASVLRLATAQEVRQEVTSLRGALQGFAQAERERVRRLAPGTGAPPRDVGMWREAAALVPERTIPGPFAFQDAPDAVRRDFETELGRPIDCMEWTGGAPNLFWVDGKRSLATICELTQLFQPRLQNDQALESMLKLYRFLERHQYIRWRQP